MPITLGMLASSYYAAGGTPTAPSFILSRTSGPAVHGLSDTLTTGSFDVTNGDLIVVVFTGESEFATPSTPVGSLGSFTYTSRQFSYAASHCGVQVWTAAVTSNQTGMTVSSTVTTQSGDFWCGLTVLLFRAHGGVGNVVMSISSNTNYVATADIATSLVNSAVVFVNADWTAQNQTGHTWLTTAGVATDVLYGSDPTNSRYGWAIGYYGNVGAVGAKKVGETAPGTQALPQVPSMIALEVKGA